MAAGFDYGLGTTNVDVATGIRYGVIHQGEVLQAWVDESVAQYGTPTCPLCGATDMWETPSGRMLCLQSDCGGLHEPEQCYPEDALGHTYEDAEYTIEQRADFPDLFIIKSPYYSLCKFCSPCAPGAGYLMDQEEDGIKAYALGVDWFEDEQPPYALYLVATGRCIYTPTSD